MASMGYSWQLYVETECTQQWIIGIPDHVRRWRSENMAGKGEVAGRAVYQD